MIKYTMCFPNPIDNRTQTIIFSPIPEPEPYPGPSWKLYHATPSHPPNHLHPSETYSRAWLAVVQIKKVGFICTAVQIILWLFVQQASSVWYGFLPIWNLRKYLRVLAQGEGSPSPGLTLGVRMVLALIQSTLQWSNVKVQIQQDYPCNLQSDKWF